MTQFFTYQGFSLRRAGLHIRVLITAFLLVAAVALAVGVLNYWVRTGLTPIGAARYLRGDGIDLLEKSPLELLDATHPHLFGQAFFFFVLCHLFALVPARSTLKLWVYVAAFLSVLTDAASPWLIRYVSPAFGVLQIAGTVTMTAVFLMLVGWPLREMWFRDPGPRAAAPPR
ncbi:MAG TPA: hypothetical protein VK837_11515 [Longimicrobiales bacterium]|nr:hypothetical protein [Longimicrobiales bacterium]